MATTSPTIATVSRRRLLRGAAATAAVTSAAAVFPSRMASAAAPAAHTVIQIFLRGGADGLSLVAPGGDPALRALRPTTAPDPDRLLDLDGTFGLHPRAVGLKNLWDSGVCSIAFGAGTPLRERSHFANQRFVDRGGDNASLGVDTSGWASRWLGDDQLFDSVTVSNATSAALRGARQTIATTSLTGWGLWGWFYDGASVLTSLPAMWDAFGGGASPDLSTGVRVGYGAASELHRLGVVDRTPNNQASYPGGVGASLKVAADLIAADLAPSVVCIDSGGWDYHDQVGDPLTGGMAQLIAALDASIEAFVVDMADNLGDITVLVGSEFGRRVLENGSGGFDHGRGGVMFHIGGNAAPKTLVHDFAGLDHLDDGDVPVTVDARSVIAEALGAADPTRGLQSVFPGLTDPAPGLARPA